MSDRSVNGMEVTRPRKRNGDRAEGKTPGQANCERSRSFASLMRRRAHDRRGRRHAKELRASNQQSRNPNSHRVRTNPDGRSPRHGSKTPGRSAARLRLRPGHGPSGQRRLWVEAHERPSAGPARAQPHGSNSCTHAIRQPPGQPGSARICRFLPRRKAQAVESGQSKLEVSS
jgi:hypothetical protein